MPDVPTFAEAGYPAFKGNAWFALFAPAGTPSDVIKKVNEGINETLTVKSVRKAFEQNSIEPLGGPPDDLKS